MLKTFTVHPLGNIFSETYLLLTSGPHAHEEGGGRVQVSDRLTTRHAAQSEPV